MKCSIALGCHCGNEAPLTIGCKSLIDRNFFTVGLNEVARRIFDLLGRFSRFEQHLTVECMRGF